MSKQDAHELNRLMKLSTANHDFLDSLRCITYNDALSKIINYVKKNPDFKKELLLN